MPIRMTALREFVYAGKRLKKGDQFDVAGESQRRVLLAVRHAEMFAAPPPAASAPTPARRLSALVATAPAESTADRRLVAGEVAAPPEAEAAPREDGEDPAPKPKTAPAKTSRYRRRDLQAE